MNRICVSFWLALVMSVLTSGCAIQCRQATFHRYEAVALTEGFTATPLMGGGIRLENQTGLSVFLASIWLRDEEDAAIVMQIDLAKGHRFQFLETDFIALGLKENARERLKLEPISFQRTCSVSYPSKSLFSKAVEPPTPEAACPERPVPVNGPVEVKETDSSMPGRSILIFRTYKFDPSLEFRGEDIKTFQTIVMRGLRLGTDMVLVPPRIAIDGNEVRLPSISLKTVHDKLCHVQELM